MSLLSQLSSMTAIVADTGDIDLIEKIKPLDATTNPSLLLKVANSGNYERLLEKAIKLTEQPQYDSSKYSVAEIFAVLVGVEISKLVDGRISTEVDARLSFDTQAMIETAERLILLYDSFGVSRDRILIKIASTWEGIKAAESLEKRNIQCNLTLLFNMAQARACAEAGVFLISPFVGRIYDYFKAQSPDTYFTPDQDPGVLSVKSIYNYYRKHGYETIVMGASFRSKEQVLALAGCDRLTVSPAILDELAQSEGVLERKLKPMNSAPIAASSKLNESDFRFALNDDPMANAKLAGGIRQFCKDQVALETLLAEKMVCEA